jgi:tetratricopeptide (TPR) repeat protein
MHKHLSDTELARFATDPEALPLERRQAIEREIGHCAICRTSVDFLSVLGAELLWDLESSEPERSSDDEREDPNMALARRIEVEDREADEVLAREKVFDSPAKTAWRNLQRDKRLLTGGVVRRLCAHANTIYESEPLDALTFADAAISVAETLPDNTYPRQAVFDLRGTAWKERANALMVLGEYPAAFDALTHAERAYSRSRLPEFGLFTVALVRASLFYEQGRLDDAAAWAERAEYGFARIAQEERRMRAVFLRAIIKYEARDFASAVELLGQVMDYGEAVNSSSWIGRASYAIGNCEVDRGDLAEASLHFHKALIIFREIGPPRDRIAAEYGLARVVLHGGKREEAIRRLWLAAEEYERLSMISDAALVKLDVVDALLSAGETKQISEIAARLFHTFRNAGMMTGALTAMAYLREAAAAGRLTAAGVNTVRKYLRRAERQPETAFTPPPEAPR